MKNKKELRANKQLVKKHKLLLIGHKKAVVALCITQIETDTSLNADVLISAAEDG